MRDKQVEGQRDRRREERGACRLFLGRPVSPFRVPCIFTLGFREPTQEGATSRRSLVCLGVQDSGLPLRCLLSFRLSALSFPPSLPFLPLSSRLGHIP